MAYYRGDYYSRGTARRGDYYRGRLQRGDPFWAGLFRGITAVGRAIIGLPASGATGAATTAATSAATLPARRLPTVLAGLPKIGTAATSIARSPATRNIASMVAAGTLVEIGGRWFNQETGKFVKMRRSINYCNPKALRRSMRRVQGFAKVAQRTISFTKRVKMKKRRRAA